MISYLEALKWRYATKRMTGEKIAPEAFERILEAIRLSPSSLGLQPYRIFVIQDAATRERLLPVCDGQTQIMTSSALLVFAAVQQVADADVDAHISRVSKERGVSIESLEGLRKGLAGASVGKSEAWVGAWARNQAYIALGVGLMACALEGVDSTPMEGFDPAGVDEVLGLREQGLRSCVLLAVGRRDVANDRLAGQAKVRKPADLLFTRI